MNENGREQAIHLVRTFHVQKVNHATHILHAVYLTAQIGVLVKEASHQTTMFSRGYHTFSLYAHAAWSTDYLTVHVLALFDERIKHGSGFLANGPLGDVVGPFVAFNVVAILRIETAHATRIAFYVGSGGLVGRQIPFFKV